MAILKPELRSGHRDGLIFQPVGDKQVVRSMPSHYHTSQHPRLVEYREKFRNLVLLYRALRGCMESCFQFGTSRQSTFNRFMAKNLPMAKARIDKGAFKRGEAVLEPIYISDGTLPTLDVKMETNSEGSFLCFSMKSADWKSGDILRFVSLQIIQDSSSASKITNGSYSDTLINYPKDEILYSPLLSPGGYTFLHIRDTRKGRLVSTQQLILIS